jgi:hypoxanthine phosphoribosyltransferase
VILLGAAARAGGAGAAASEAGASLAPVPLEIPDFQAYCGLEPPQFQNEAELGCAKILDYYAIPWEYEPRTFVLEQNEEGRIAEAFTPDFYLPEQDLYLEVTVMKQSLVTRKNRKLRKLRERYPDVNVKLFYKRDIERLARRYRLDIAS